MTDRPVALFALAAEHWPLLFPPTVRQRLGELADIDTDLVVDSFDDPRVAGRLDELEVLITGWGCPPLDAEFLAAGTEAARRTARRRQCEGPCRRRVWERGIAGLLGRGGERDPGRGVRARHDPAGRQRRLRAPRALPQRSASFTLAYIHPDVGNYGRRVGIIGASRIGRQVIELLAAVRLRGPALRPVRRGPRRTAGEPAGAAGASDIVSVHAPSTPETHHMIDRGRLALLPDGAVLINTARGELVDTER